MRTPYPNTFTASSTINITPERYIFFKLFFLFVSEKRRLSGAESVDSG